MKQDCHSSGKCLVLLLIFLNTDLLVSSVEQQVPLRPSEGQTEAVESMDSSQEKADEAKLLPTLQPAFQPLWEKFIFGTIIQLVDRCQLARQVHQGQECDSDGGQGPIHYLYWDLVEVTLLVFKVRMDYITSKRIRKKENREGHGSEDRTFPIVK